MKRKAVAKARSLYAMRNESWSVAGALAEFVDNSRGKGRGNADRIWIEYDRRKRVLSVLDDGIGMRPSVFALFCPGEGAPQVEDDIGFFGYGGSKALLWLFAQCTIWTLRNNKMNFDKVDWDRQFELNDYPDIEEEWVRANPRKMPRDLYRLKHGTKIVGTVLKGRIVREENIKRDLAIKFAPALAAGKQIWFNGQPLESAMPVFQTSVQVHCKVRGGRLEAIGEVGLVRDLPHDAAKVHLCFADRVIHSTRDFFVNLQGEGMAATHVTGFIKLKGHWLLTTTKERVSSDEDYQSLRKQVIHQIQSILALEEEQQLSIAFQDIALEMSDLTLGDLTVKRATIDAPKIESQGGKRGPIKQPRQYPDQPEDPNGKEEPRRAAKLKFAFDTDENMKGALCSFNGQDTNFVAIINKEHPYMANTRANRRPILATVVGEFASKINEEKAFIHALFSKSATRMLMGTEDMRLRRQRIHRALVDRMSNAANE
jgi:hypothetical protein